MRAFGVLLQVAPLAFATLLVFIVSGASLSTSTQPGVSVFSTPMFAFAMCLALLTIAATFSRRAAAIAALLTLAVLALAGWVAVEGNGGFGIILGAATLLSLAGWVIRARADRAIGQQTSSS